MEGLALGGLVQVVVMALVVMMWRAEVGNAGDNMHYVGGNKISWAPNVNLSEWSSHETFYVGEWLFFGYYKHLYNVLEVNETSYEKCIEKQFIKNVTGGAGRDVFNLTQAKTYYFISAGGYCYQGMKVAIPVLKAIPPSPPPTTTPTTSSSTTTTIDVVTPLLLVLLVFFVEMVFSVYI